MSTALVGGPLTGTASDSYAGAFDELMSDASAPAQLQSMRRAAFDRFGILGFPTTKNEDWHFTSVSPIAEQEFTFLGTKSGNVRREQLAQFAFGAHDWHTMVFVNGRFAPALSDAATKLPNGVKSWDLASAWTTAPEVVEQVGKIANYDAHAFTALNTAFMLDGAVLQIAKDTEVARPIHLVFVTDAAAAKGMMHPRNLIVAGKHSKATIIESYVSTTDAMYFNNAVTEVSVGDGATLQHYKMQRESARAFHVGTIDVRQARDSHYVSFSFAIGAALARSNVYSTLDGEGSGVTLNGLYM
ncbi:MAG TPA: SufD family Fe-S cluster assembly protein, partial [Gemmatimonadaceae bacterium]|nr:SufD family Fe-S cluster assembly protein [Gemmatimonadaceae bacterium]